MSAVSIFHAPRDEALSEKIAAALARAGHAATRISADPMVGDLANEPADDGAAIVVWTEAAAKLARLHEQAREAMARGALIPVAVGGARPPGGFESLPPVDLSGWSGALDDPRWRFVLDEIEIARQRTQLEDGAVWPDQDAPAETAAEDSPKARAVDQFDEEPALSVRTPQPEDPPASNGAEQDAYGALYAKGQPALLRGQPARRRFKSRDVAIGATVGLVAMTLATAVLAPIVLPGLSVPQTPPARPAQSVPDPSVDEPSRLSSLQSPERAPPVSEASTGAQTGVSSGQIKTAPAEKTPVAGALDGDEAASAEKNAGTQTPPTPDGATKSEAQEKETPAAEFEPNERAASDAPLSDQALGLNEPSLKPQRLSTPSEERAPDSDAMGNLVASIAAQEAGVATPRAEIDPLPEELRETAYLGNYFKECVACPDMAALPGGSFRMGAPMDESGAHPTEGPAHVVTIDHRFAIGTREVTYDQWDACVADDGCRAYRPPDHGWGRGKRPVASVSHADAQAYTAWLSDKTGHNYRLPTEAEWEFAARAGVAAPFAFGDRITSARANFNGNHPYLNEKSAFRGRTTPVASFQPNAFGLFDMHGNVWEWTSDCWSESHAGAPSDGAARIAGDCSRRVLKGGAWNTGAWRLRSAHRIGKPVNMREFDNGFRVARDLD